MPDDDAPGDPADPAPPAKPPLLDYPSRQNEPTEIDTEPLPKVVRAFATIFGVLLAIFVILGLLCGVVPNGCD